MDAQIEQPRGIRTTCPFCGVGCGIVATVSPTGDLSVRGDSDHPANFGRLCSKGTAVGETTGLDGRLLFPEIHGRCAGWNEALDLVAAKFLESIRQHGPDSLAFYVSGQLLTEDYYVANKLMKGFVGSANIDTNSRLCMASSVAGHRRAFGSDTVPGTYRDLELADLVVLTGSNLAWCHPVLYQRIAAAKQARPGMKVVLVDPRRTMTAELADLHLPIKADGDVALFSGLLAWLAEHDLLDWDYIAAHTTCFEEAMAAASSMSMAEIAARTGLDEPALAAFFKLFAASPRVVTVYSQGVNQSASGTDKVNAIINCHLATGRIGKPGTGPFSVTGQPNAMGGREVGGLANMLACHMEIGNQHHREIVQSFWRSPTIADSPGLKAVDLFAAAADGRIKALWIMATNPVDSMPEADLVRAAIARCPFVVVSDVLAATDTVGLAHVKLPAAAWGEKDGTVTNSERRISRQRAVLPLPGEARPDWWIICEVARRMGFADAFAYTAPAEIFAEHAALSAFGNGGRRDFDIGAFAGIEGEAYEDLKPFQWPRPVGSTSNETRFFANGGFYTPDRRARFIAVGAAAERRTSAVFPFVLNSGRVRDHWHTMTRTGMSARLSAHTAEPFAELHPADAARLRIADADIVRVASIHGEVLVRALVTERQQRGSVFVPMHWTDQYAAKARVGALVAVVTDPISGQPASKNVAVRVERFGASAFGFAICREQPRAVEADYWATARCKGGWRIELALAEEKADWSAFAAALFGRGVREGMLTYHDPRAGRHRIAAFDNHGLVGALFVAREPVAVSRSWAAEQFGAEHPDPRSRFSVIAGRAGDDQPDPGATICSCFSVGINQICGAVAAGCASVEAIGEALKAGTNCGSCRAEIRTIIEARRG